MAALAAASSCGRGVQFKHRAQSIRWACVFPIRALSAARGAQSDTRGEGASRVARGGPASGASRSGRFPSAAPSRPRGPAR
eukprot:1492771-Prymnesium_polylepis.1